MSNDTPTSVYQYHDSAGRILYVGVTARGIRRAHEHAETKEWWQHATGCSIEHYPDRDSALAREAALIARFSPPFNTVHNARKAEAKERWMLTEPAKVGAGVMVRDGELTARRTAWYAMSKQERLKVPCVRCGVKPSGPRGPECPACHPIGGIKTN